MASPNLVLPQTGKAYLSLFVDGRSVFLEAAKVGVIRPWCPVQNYNPLHFSNEWVLWPTCFIIRNSVYESVP